MKMSRLTKPYWRRGCRTVGVALDSELELTLPPGDLAFVALIRAALVEDVCADRSGGRPSATYRFDGCGKTRARYVRRERATHLRGYFIEGRTITKRIVYAGSDGKWACRLLTAVARVIARDGGQGYNDAADARKIADRIIDRQFKDVDKQIIRPE
jgi:hypothetical protein